MTEAPNNTYCISWGLSSIRHLSASLYSNAPAALTEVVANAWDADAERVDITVNEDEKYIEFLDDGIGMSLEDINKKYLTVGYQKRDVEGKKPNKDLRTNKGRLFMGRKGLGKLALFFLAKTIEVQTMKKNSVARGFRMNIDDIEASAKLGKEYNPKVVPENEIKIKKEGTLIRLEKVQRKRIDLTTKAFIKRLSYRFSVIGDKHNFNIYLNNEQAIQEKRIEFTESECVWKIGEIEDDIPKAKNKFALPGRLDNWEADWNVKGWIATVYEPKSLNDKEAGNLNKITVLARGRLFEEDIFSKISENRFYARYLIGEINADFLDQDKMPDIATSDRQNVIEDDERHSQLIEFLNEQLTKIVKKWDAIRTENGRNRKTKYNQNAQNSYITKQYNHILKKMNSQEKQSCMNILEILAKDFGVGSENFQKFIPSVLDSKNSTDILNRKSWIPSDIDNFTAGKGHRAEEMFAELSKASILNITSAKNASAIMVRTFVETSVKYYLRKNNNGINNNNRTPLSKLINIAIEIMNKKGCSENIIIQGEKLKSDRSHVGGIQTMNEWVHSPDFSPFIADIITSWNNYKDFITECWKE